MYDDEVIKFLFLWFDIHMQSTQILSETFLMHFFLNIRAGQLK